MILQMDYKKWLLKFMTPFLLVSYTCIVRALVMIVRGNTGFGLVYIEFLIVLALIFIVADFILKKLFGKNIKIVLLLEATISLILLFGSLYLEFRKSNHEPATINVQPV
jgi:hypothetical protein